jgi:transposase
MMPNNLLPWPAVYQQTQRWRKAGVFASMVDDLRAVLRLLQGRKWEVNRPIGAKTAGLEAFFGIDSGSLRIRGSPYGWHLKVVVASSRPVHMGFGIS